MNMSSNTKIVVLRSKELIYALVLLFVVVLIIAVAISLFMPEKKNNSNNSDKSATSQETQATISTNAKDTTEDTDSTETANLYVPGLYTSVIQLGNATLELQITVDNNHINSISFATIDESVTTMYPLMEPALSELSTQIITNQSIENINFADESRYTSMLLMQAISETLEKAKVSENSDSPVDTLSNKEIN